jgi:hypothetical protein
MIDGVTLAADHSHKIVKVIQVAGQKTFEGIYTIMNPHGQIMGYWLTNGTSLEEVKPHIEKLMGWFHTHHYKGLSFLTVDRCYQERSFWEQHLRQSEIADEAQLDQHKK